MQIMSKSRAVKIAQYSNCLSYDTEILAIVRGLTPIKLAIGTIVERKLNCLVYSINRETNFTNIQKIEQWHEHGEQEIFEYTLDNGATIEATKDHKFMTTDGQMLSIDRIFEQGLDLVCRHSYIIDGYDFKSIIPDYYTCPYTYGNTCGFGIVKFDRNYAISHQGCTEGYRTYVDPELDRKYNSKYSNNLSLYFDNWMLSRTIEYDNYSVFVNNCINGYRNITYVKQQQAIDSNFTSEDVTTPKHTYIALNNAIAPSIELYESLCDACKFDEKHLISFSYYLGSHSFLNHFRDFSARKPEHIESVKDIFDYVVAHPNIAGSIVTEEIVTEFQQQYRIYQEDSKKYANETKGEKYYRLNMDLISQGKSPRHYFG